MVRKFQSVSKAWPGSSTLEPELNRLLEAGHLSPLTAFVSTLITEHPECHEKLNLFLLLVPAFPPIQIMFRVSEAITFT